MRYKLLQKIFLKEYALDDEKSEILNTIFKNSEEKFLYGIYGSLNKITKRKSDRVNMKENISGIKNEILEIIKNLEDEEEVEKIFSYINRKFILESIRSYMINKIGSVGNKEIDKLIANIIIDANTSYKDKVEFVVYLKNKGYLFEGKEIIDRRIGNVYSLVNIKNSTYEKIKRQIANLQGSLGFKQIQGPGELFLVLFGKDINFSSSEDINIAGLEIEVKSSRKGISGSLSGGRFSGTSFYANMSSVKPLFLKSLERAGIEREDLENNKDSLNLNYKGINNLNDLIKKYSVKYRDVFNVFLNVFKNIFVKFSENDIKDYMSRFIRNDGTIDASEFKKTALILSFKYYKFIEGFDLVLLINVDSGNFLIIEEPEDLEENYDILRISSVPSWSEGRKPSISPEIVLK